MTEKDKPFDITQPLWDQRTFVGRVKHFAFMTDPRTVFATDKDLDDAKTLYHQYK